MVEDIITADSLHLLHLGVTKTLLKAYKNGKPGMTISKWSNGTLDDISRTLVGIKLPAEFHRAVRGLNYLSHWKASECSVFLNYIGIIVLKPHLPEVHYKHFLNLFCAVTICSTHYYRRFLPIARQLFDTFVKTNYRIFRSVTMNIHNLNHIVDEVERFGDLSTLSSYPFENNLYKIKLMLRSGRFPLCQIVNRLSEITSSQINSQKKIDVYPLFKYPVKNDISKYHYVELREGFLLRSNFENKWFMNRNRDIIAMEYVNPNGIFGLKLRDVKEFFKYPLLSTHLNVFQTEWHDFHNLEKYSFKDVLCKLVAVVVFDKTVFVPMHHTFPVNEFL